MSGREVTCGLARFQVSASLPGRECGILCDSFRNLATASSFYGRNSRRTAEFGFLAFPPWTGLASLARKIPKLGFARHTKNSSGMIVHGRGVYREAGS